MEKRECRGANGVALTIMSEHQKHTEFLRHCILYDESAKRQELHERITQIQRDARCVRRAVWLGFRFAVRISGLTPAPSRRRLLGAYSSDPNLRFDPFSA